MIVRKQTDARHAPRRGFVIVAVLMVVVVLSLAAYQYADLMSAEAKAAERIRKTTESRAFAQSGIHAAMAYVADPDAFEGTLNRNPFDNPSAFQAFEVQASDAPTNKGRFSLVSYDLSDTAGLTSAPVRYGLTDEAAKINPNALLALDSSGRVLHDALMKLPDMTDEIAWSIVDWIDPDEEENSGGAESQYYSSLTPAYQAKNAPLETVEELLLVQGMTPALLFGNDRNRNGKLDPDEDDGFGGYNPGWAAYLTVYSRERNVAADGLARVNLNGTDLTQLKTDLTAVTDEDIAYLILAYRLYGSGSGGGGGGGGGGIIVTGAGALGQLKAKVDEDLKNGVQPRQNVSSIFALVNAQISVQVPNPDPNAPPQLRMITLRVTSPLQNDVGLQREVLPKLLDLTTTQATSELPAKVNINTAPREVLLALPGLTESYVDSILVRRPTYTNGQAPDASFDTIAWLLTDAQVPVATLQSLERYVTARTQVYRVQALGYFDEGGPVSRVEAVIDVNGGKPRIAYFRDLTDLGRSINPRTLGQ
jgi:type II secretory pathway component PulK